MDLFKVFVGIILLRLGYKIIKAYAKQPEKLQFILFTVKKYPILAINPILSIAMIVLAIYERWPFNTIVILISLGVVISIIEDAIVVATVRSFRSKEFKIDDQEITSEDSDKSKIWLMIIASSAASLGILYFVKREVNWNFDNLLAEYWLILIFLIGMSFISILRVWMSSVNNDEPYDASIIFVKMTLRPFGLVIFAMAVTSLTLFPELIALVIFLICYSLITFVGQCIGLIMTLPKEEQNLLRNDYKQAMPKKRL